MILATDVGYHDDRTAVSAGVLFQKWDDPNPVRQVKTLVSNVAEYTPGEFYRRELPCLMALLDDLGNDRGLLTTIIVDGFVDLEPGHPGLGRHLSQALSTPIPILGVAKTLYHGARTMEVLRGGSNRPLYVTTCGLIPLDQAAWCVQNMHGANRLPTMLKLVDTLSRS